MDVLIEKYKRVDENNQLLSAYRPLPPETLKSLREYYRVGLTYTSNALEGNSLTESETKVVIEDGLTIEGKPLRDHYEAVGHAKAYDYIYQITEKAHTDKDVFLVFIVDRVIATQQDLLRLMRDENDTVNDTVKSFSKTEQTVLAAISSHPDFSYEKLAETCLLSRPTIARIIKTLQSREVIRRIGPDKKGHWQIIDK